MNALVLDIGGSNVKALATGQKEPRRLPSGPMLTPREMVAGIRRLTTDWSYEAVSIGYPGPVLQGKPCAEPHNLGAGWVAFNYASAFNLTGMTAKKQDARKLDHKTLEVIRIRAVRQVQSGQGPEVVIKALGFSRACIYQWLARHREGGREDGNPNWSWTARCPFSSAGDLPIRRLT